MTAREGAEQAFLDVGLDYGDADRFSDAERDTLFAWYERTHGGLDVVKFAPFLVEFLPGAFKASRQEVMVGAQPVEGEPIPDVAIQLCYMASYAALAFPEGVRYEMQSAGSLGATKALVLDVLSYAYLSAGPRGMNAVAELSSDLLREWRDDAAPAIVWPEGWAPDPAVFRSGIDHTTPDLTAEERDLLNAWHERHYGVAPRSIELFGRLHPRAFKLQRIRYEKAIGAVMPAQLAPLLTLQLATIRFQPLVMRQAVHQARYLGVARQHVARTIVTGLRGQSVVPQMVEAVAEAVGDLLAGWDDARTRSGERKG